MRTGEQPGSRLAEPVAQPPSQIRLVAEQIICSGFSPFGKRAETVAIRVDQPALDAEAQKPAMQPVGSHANTALCYARKMCN